MPWLHSPRNVGWLSGKQSTSTSVVEVVRRSLACWRDQLFCLTFQLIFKLKQAPQPHYFCIHKYDTSSSPEHRVNAGGRVRDRRRIVVISMHSRTFVLNPAVHSCNKTIVISAEIQQQSLQLRPGSTTRKH